MGAVDRCEIRGCVLLGGGPHMVMHQNSAIDPSEAFGGSGSFGTAVCRESLFEA
jgi:hypothetical protein